MEVPPLKTLEWADDALRLIDQRQLPGQIVFERCETVDQVARAISELRVRGAPAIGIAAAYGMALAARQSAASTVEDLARELQHTAGRLQATRPTAVNLAWALARSLASIEGAADVASAQAAVLRCADEITAEDLAACRAIGAHGATLIPPGSTILTHCNAGGLATAGYGTALGIVRAAHERGLLTEVLVDETRPVLQGARLTAWEMQQEGIPATLIADVAAAHFMARGRVQAVVVGADRIAANGDVANKIGTYALAVLSAAHGIPFFVAAPSSTIDLSTKSGSDIPIEERAAAEVTTIGGTRIAPVDFPVANPAFDVTPARYVTAIVTEHGVLRAPFAESLARVMATDQQVAALRR